MHDASIRRVRRFPPWQDGALRQRLHLRGGLSRRMSDVKVVKVSLPRSSDPALSMCFLEGGTSNFRDFLIFRDVGRFLVLDGGLPTYNKLR